MARQSGNQPKAFADLRAFIDYLESQGELVRVRHPVSPHLEMTEICTRLLAERGPAVLFEQVVGHDMPVLTNLFGTQERVGMAIGQSLEELERLGELLADLRCPEPPARGGLLGAFRMAPKMARIRHMPMRLVRSGPCQEVVMDGTEVNLKRLPLQTCWPEDAGALITWPLVITRALEGGPVNIGVYRMQVIGRNKLIMRWLRHRGGAKHLASHGGRRMPVAVAIGCDPGTILAAVTPVPDALSEYAFAGLLREERVAVVRGQTVDLPIPATAEIVLEGEVDPNEKADEGPFGDHTGYYNEVERFAVFTVRRITMRRQPIYLTTFTGRPPDEPSVLALALNRVFTPLLKRQFPEITDFHLPAETCSYRLAVVALRKDYPGHAFRAMAGVWGFLRQFLYTKIIIVVDQSVNIRDWDEVMQAVALNVDANRDFQILKNTPIDYLDFAAPVSGLGSKLGIDATTKMEVEQQVVPVRTHIPTVQSWDWPRVMRRMVSFLNAVHLMPGGVCAVLQVDKREPSEGRKAAEAIWRMVPPGAGADQVWVVDLDVDPRDWTDILWAAVTRVDPARDILIDERGGRFAVDATHKLPGETSRVWGRPLIMDPKVVQRVSDYWEQLGIPTVSGQPVWRDKMIPEPPGDEDDAEDMPLEEDGARKVDAP
ncbi:MAG: UbiD family decarboxylase [Magnetococcus sp. WYHC-3]